MLYVFRRLVDKKIKGNAFTKIANDIGCSKKCNSISASCIANQEVENA